MHVGDGGPLRPVGAGILGQRSLPAAALIDAVDIAVRSDEADAADLALQHLKQRAGLELRPAFTASRQQQSGQQHQQQQAARHPAAARCA